MSVDTLKSLLVTADPKATEGFGASTGNYTVWRMGIDDGLYADEVLVEGKVTCYVERFTKVGNDSIVSAIDSALKSSSDIAIKEHVTDYESDTKYVHHTWTVEVI